MSAVVAALLFWWQVTPVDENNKEIGSAKFIRTGLLGFVGTVC